LGFTVAFRVAELCVTSDGGRVVTVGAGGGGEPGVVSVTSLPLDAPSW
jgi:hypothetical protein